MILGAAPITRRRYAAATRGSDGRAVLPTPTDTTIQSAWQPMGGRALALLPEGERSKEWRTGQTTSDLRTADQGAGTPADRLVFGDGAVFEVHVVRHFSAVLPHYEFDAVRLQEVA